MLSITRAAMLRWSAVADEAGGAAAASVDVCRVTEVLRVQQSKRLPGGRSKAMLKLALQDGRSLVTEFVCTCERTAAGQPGKAGSVVGADDGVWAARDSLVEALRAGMSPRAAATAAAAAAATTTTTAAAAAAVATTVTAAGATGEAAMAVGRAAAQVLAPRELSASATAAGGSAALCNRAVKKEEAAGAAKAAASAVSAAVLGKSGSVGLRRWWSGGRVKVY